MSRAVIDQKFRITQPEELRRSGQIEPGMEVEVSLKHDTLNVSPVSDSSAAEPDLDDYRAKLAALRGVLPPGTDTSIPDDPEDNPWMS